VKRADLIRTLEGMGCVLIRHGAKHDWYRNLDESVSCQSSSPRSISGSVSPGMAGFARSAATAFGPAGRSNSPSSRRAASSGPSPSQSAYLAMTRRA